MAVNGPPMWPQQPKDPSRDPEGSLVTILEQRHFGGLTLEETAEALGLSLATVKRELRAARAWLAIELGGEADSGAFGRRATC